MSVIFDVLRSIWTESGFAHLADWRTLVMLVLACVLLYLGIVKKYEPLLMIGIAFGMLLTNLPGANLYHPELWDAFLAGEIGYGDILHEGGLLDILYIGVKSGLYPSLIFLGVGAMTDFGPPDCQPQEFVAGICSPAGRVLCISVGHCHWIHRPGGRLHRYRGRR